LKQQIEDLRRQLETAQVELRELYAAQHGPSPDSMGEHIAQPLTYLLTQLSLADRGQAVSTDSLLKSIRLLTDSCVTAGIRFIGTCAEPAKFDPNLHIPPNSQVGPNDIVRVVVPGMAMPSGRVARRAIVEVP
jgi:molecular chaperone GrpE (heat shock protein)